MAPGDRARVLAEFVPAAVPDCDSIFRRSLPECQEEVDFSRILLYTEGIGTFPKKQIVDITIVIVSAAPPPAHEMHFWEPFPIFSSN